jgi:hypothetical protein
MGIFVLINAIDAMHSNDKVESTLGYQYPKLALTTGIIQIVGALLEFYTVKVVFDGYKYLRDVISNREDRTKCENA